MNILIDTEKARGTLHGKAHPRREKSTVHTTPRRRRNALDTHEDDNVYLWLFVIYCMYVYCIRMP